MSDYNAQKRPYWIEDVIGGGKYTPKVEEHGQVMENKLVAYEILEGRHFDSEIRSDL